jgi:hypothetical protein
MISHTDKAEEADLAAGAEEIKPKAYPFPFLKQAKGKFHSPTDNMFSPATKKVEAKRNHLLKS